MATDPNKDTNPFSDDMEEETGNPKVKDDDDKNPFSEDLDDYRKSKQKLQTDTKPPALPDGYSDIKDGGNLLPLDSRDYQEVEDRDVTHREEGCCYTPKRYVIVLLLSLGMFIAHAMRVNVAVTVVTILDKNPAKTGSNKLPHVAWSATDVGLLHSVFYMGYIVTQLPGGYLATRLPSHRLFGASVLISGAFNMLLPVTIMEGSYALTCVVRVIQGLSEGLLYPTCYAVMGHWTTPSERSWLGSIVLTGVYLGPMVGLALSGALTYYAGWQYVYYVHSIGVIIWFVLWLFFAYEKPGHHPGISFNELKMIEREQGLTSQLYQRVDIPWRAIFKSLPVHALNICNFARNWVFYLLLTNEPTYVNMFGFHMAQNGVLSALPHALMVIVVISTGPLADLLIHRTPLTRTKVRKLFTGLGFGIEALCFIILAILVTGIPSISILTIGVGLSGLTVSGWQINHLDLAPRFAGVLVAISTTVGTVAAIIIPLITGVLTKNMTIEGWHNVFYLTAAILAVSVVFYSVFGTGELQPWANPHSPVQIVNQKGPLDAGGQPYGTFPGQVELEHPTYTPPDVLANARKRSQTTDSQQ